jgi:Trk K+ transport system NAD-binding subunit
MPGWVRRSIVERVLRGAPVVEEIYRPERDWAVSVVTVKEGARNIGLSVADVGAEGDIEILGIDRADTYLNKPSWDEKIAVGDRLLVYADRKAVRRVLSQ